MKVPVLLTSAQAARINEALFVYASRLTHDAHRHEGKKVQAAAFRRVRSVRATREYVNEQFALAQEKAAVVVRTFDMDDTQGSAAMLVGSRAEGLPLASIERKRGKVIATYKNP